MLSGLALIALIVFIRQYPALRAIVRARNCKVEVEWNRNSPNRVGGIVVVKISVRLIKQISIQKRHL